MTPISAPASTNNLKSGSWARRLHASAPRNPCQMGTRLGLGASAPWESILMILVVVSGFLLVQPLAAQGEKPSFTAQPGDRELAAEILKDQRMDVVVAMGRELLKSGLNAGSSYNEVWIRDLNTFIVPLLEAAAHEPVREALLTFLHFQGEDGNIIDGYVPTNVKDAGYKYRFSDSRPDLKAHKNTVETDQESSLVQAVCRYVAKTNSNYCA